MRLLVDIGNSRVKWATLEGDRLGEQRAADHSGWGVDDWRRNLFDRPGIEQVTAATVAGGPSADALDAAARHETGRAALFVTTQREAAGVRNGYADYHLLGVDRWLAVIGAFARVGAACCVADIGTAATFDAVTDEGQHLGGYIVPGPGLMMRSLWGGTAELAGRTASSGAAADAPLADNTRDAIGRGCHAAVAAFIDRSVTEVARRIGHAPALLLTGGAAEMIRPRLETASAWVPDLVLRGLAVVVSSEAKAGS